MSEHFLDTETRHQLPATALICVEAGLLNEEIEQTWRYDVAPVLGPNLKSPAGEWRGWAADEITQRIHARSRSPLQGVRRALNWPPDPLPGYREVLTRTAALLRRRAPGEAREELVHQLATWARAKIDPAEAASADPPQELGQVLEPAFPRTS